MAGLPGKVTLALPKYPAKKTSPVLESYVMPNPASLPSPAPTPEPLTNAPVAAAISNKQKSSFVVTLALVSVTLDTGTVVE